MKLDDRPVIDQLLNPTPLSHLYGVQDELHDLICDSEEHVQSEVDEHLFTLLNLVPEGERDAALKRIALVAADVAEGEQARAREMLSTFVRALEARL